MKFLIYFLILFSSIELTADSIPLREGWEVLDTDLPVEEISADKISFLEGWKKYSTNIPLTAEKTHLLKLRLPEKEFRQPVLHFGKNIFSFEVIYAGKSVYKFADKTQFEPGRFLGWVSQIVSIPKNREDNTVYLRVYSGAKIGFAAVSYGEKDEIYEEIISSNLPGIAVFVISMLLGIIFFSIYIFSSRDLFYLATASFYIFIGIWLFNINPISQFVLPESPWRLRSEYISLYLAPIGCLFFLESIVISRLNIISRFLRYILFLYAVISAFLDLAGIFPLWKTLIPFDIFLIFSFLHYIYQVIVYSYRGNKEARIIGIGIILLVSFALHDILVVLRVVDNIMLMHLGTLSFILSMTGVAVLRITYLYSDLKKKTRELEENNKALDDLNQNLEHKVVERTKEVTEKMNLIENLMNQQNGDYFLTSLIQKPLLTNRNKSSIVQTEVYIKQKKKFAFNGKESELGGDLCITGNLRFYSETERYVFFFNGDAMGKSMQGAGGAIVAGTVVNNIIARSARDNKVLHMNPDEWLLNTFREIDEIFCTFDGSMLLSAAAGIIQESTGLLWYSNFEHPRTILYRDKRADFIDSEKDSTFKFGSMIEGLEYPIMKFQLEKGDVIIVGSDGRDDLDISRSEGRERIINENYSLILAMTEMARGTISGLLEILPEYGDQTDDISFIRISY
ncbi:MAG TPA: SpoIIE family protein phosphatase [Leptospiraceae bacterium]|nr:SpoIIE family protein phosphatase [Leptospiraceae bacterium]HNF23760.1 SpoIIE family protein phosphatase [Leptospiraceae bacterium]HNO21700.1 SpoIIE family protein phosphatase [Leptospiraceae bacterium]